MKPEDAVIIGGGMGGLFTGALLARNGVRVTVLEKNSVIGGGLQSFQRYGEKFDTGMHVMGGFGENGSIKKICEYLGIFDSLSLHYISQKVMDEVRMGSGDSYVYEIPSGMDNYIAYFSSLFPEDRKGIREYVERLYSITRELPLFYLEEEERDEYSEYFMMPADALIARYIRDPKLREVLAYLSPFYDGRKGMTPAYVHALINVLYINGAVRFIDNSLQLALALQGVIERNGGKVLTGSPVERVNVENRVITGVTDSKGREYKARKYISAVNPILLLDMMPESSFPKGFERRIRSIPLTASAFSVYISFQPHSFPYIPHTCYYYPGRHGIWNQSDISPECWPSGFMYMTPPERNQGEYASKMLVHCMMDFSEVKRWEESSTGRRGEEYQRWKDEKIERVIERLSEIYPQLRSSIRKVFAGSPLTIRDYYNTPFGSAYGFMKDATNPALSQLSVFTKISNLYLTGQNIYLHGICGVPLTAITTAAAVLESKEIIKDIRES